MTGDDIVAKTAAHVHSVLDGEGTGHDWWHIYRVWKNALHILEHEQANRIVVELAALLHDIADWKFHNGDTSVGPARAREWLATLDLDVATIDHVCDIVEHVSFKGAGVADGMKTIEGKIVQDADRLDAIGAMGIARAFTYGGAKNRLLYDPEAPPVEHATFAAYQKKSGSTLNHFYEKLLLLKDRMHTETAKHIAEKRHAYMETFLDEFYAEWDGRA